MIALAPTPSQHPPSPLPLLEVSLLLAVQLLIARHPDLLLPDDVPRIRAPPILRSAHAIVALANTLLGELGHYDALDLPAGVRPLGRAGAGDDFPF
jgi:hypothetical protein